jgi:hypothetical protein
MNHPPDGKPILGGPNHPAYRVFHTWVTRLRDPALSELSKARDQSTAKVPQQSSPALPTDNDEAFATGRSASGVRRSTTPLGSATPIDSTTGPPQSAPPRITESQVGHFAAETPGLPPGQEFPDPAQAFRAPSQKTVAASPKPDSRVAGKTEPRRPSPAAAIQAPGSAKSSASNIVDLPDGTKAIRLPNGELLPYISAAAQRASPPADGPDPAKPKDDSETEGRPKINIRSYEQFIKRGSTPN